VVAEILREREVLVAVRPLAARDERHHAERAPARRQRVAYGLGGMGLLAAGFVLSPALARADYWAAWNVACAIVGAAVVAAAIGADDAPTRAAPDAAAPASLEPAKANRQSR